MSRVQAVLVGDAIGYRAEVENGDDEDSVPSQNKGKGDFTSTFGEHSRYLKAGATDVHRQYEADKLVDNVGTMSQAILYFVASHDEEWFSTSVVRDLVKDELRTTNESSNELKELLKPLSVITGRWVSERREDYLCVVL